LTKTNLATPVKNWHTVETDPIASPDTRPMFELLYFNLQKIEVMTGYESSPAKNPLLRIPKYELLEARHLEGSGKILCRMSRYRNDTLNIGQNEFLDLPVYNEYFIIDLSSTTVNNPNPIVETNLYTAGGEYQTEDGTNYIGFYHVHKDKTVMTGADMAPGEQKLIPANVVTVDIQASAANLVKTLAPDIQGFEQSVMKSILSESYMMNAPEAGSTEEPIFSTAMINTLVSDGDSF